MKTKIIIVSAPSGAGKSSFVERICKEDPRLRDTVTFTTRAMRKGESEGHPYHFVSEQRFLELRSQNYFVEWAEVHNRYYGTPLVQLEEAWKQNQCVIMDVDVQGARTFVEKYPESARSIFILPPSIKVLRSRIVNRDGRVPDDLEVRMQNAEKEMTFSSSFHFCVVNDQFEESYAEFKKIIELLLARD